ncbi:hypothetical protein IE81DRAFT_349277 [Ceraceosorus guamensis]|uniref:Uncharacterized protein n=1 Tax=Ceraceosorus guamensis TaxID=1522189 RepID=A0A316VSE0_9BASI|nr:hypothetical protein IE81DRAFT_349277 [Ceraceosorus guamensis]PWN40422.1 hypothetical protein IE81DRAFT_349277 [Ceraceosorus guamensis]
MSTNHKQHFAKIVPAIWQDTEHNGSSFVQTNASQLLNKETYPAEKGACTVHPMQPLKCVQSAFAVLLGHHGLPQQRSLDSSVLQQQPSQTSASSQVRATVQPSSFPSSTRSKQSQSKHGQGSSLLLQGNAPVGEALDDASMPEQAKVLEESSGGEAKHDGNLRKTLLTMGNAIAALLLAPQTMPSHALSSQDASNIPPAGSFAPALPQAKMSALLSRLTSCQINSGSQCVQNWLCFSSRGPVFGTPH